MPKQKSKQKSSQTAEKSIILFEKAPIRREWSEKEEKWYFSVVDVVRILTDSVDPLAYWRKLKERLKEEGNETVTNCHSLNNSYCQKR